MIDNLIKARDNKTPVTRPTKIKPDMNVEEAYNLRKELVDKLIRLKKEEIIGYKLSPKTVNNPENPEELIPVYGFLFKSMQVYEGVTLKKSDFIDLHLENEVAFIIGKDIDPKQINSASDLKKYVKFVVPAIEMPEIRYEGLINDITGIDLVVDNVVASKFILGNALSPKEVDADKVKVKMTRDGQVVNEGVATMVEGSPWNSLFWLIKQLEKEGFILKADYIVLTGGIANFMDSEPGKYKAVYEKLGKITFTIE